jgi:flavin reductase (DIM6/NTAB) family NADH-FMN oxidoreductase RutF
VPRPIGWISTVSKDGQHNIAPYAQFQNVTFEPPTVLFSACGWPAKDTLRNALETGEFVWNMATYDLRHAVAGTAVTYPTGVNEFDVMGLETLPSVRVGALRVARSPVQFECEVRHSIEIESAVPAGRATVVIAEVVGIHIADDALTDDGVIDHLKIKPLARVGYLDFTTIDRMFHVEPDVAAARANGYEPDDALRGDGNASGLFHMPEVVEGDA